MNRKITLGVLCVSLVASLFAQETAASTQPKSEKVSLTVQQAVDYATEHSRSLKMSQLDLEIKSRVSKYGWNILLPSVQVTGTMNRTTESPWDTVVSGVGQGASWQQGVFVPQSSWESIAKSAGMEDNESLHWAAVGSVGVTWDLSLAMIQGIRAAKANYEAGKITWEQSQREIETSVRKTFYGILLQQEGLKIQQSTLENSRQRATQAQTNYRNGSVPEISYLQAQVSYQNLIPDVQQAERTLAQTLDTFAMLLGLPIGTELELVGNIEPTYVDVDADDLLARYSGNNLDIQGLQRKIDLLNLQLSSSTLSTWTPSLRVAYSWNPTLGTYALDFDKWGKSSNWVNRNGGLSFTLAWNLTNMLPWSKNQQSIADTKANIAQLQLQMESALENQKVAVRKAVDTLKQAREQIDVMGRNVTLAQRSYEMSARSYRNGTTELLDLRDTEKQLEQAKLGELRAKNTYISALMDLEKALNTTLTRPAQAKSE